VISKTLGDWRTTNVWTAEGNAPFAADGHGYGGSGAKEGVTGRSWLGGCWEGRQGNVILEEIWSKPAGGSMLGLGRRVKENRTVSFEFMEFREENRSLVFLPQSDGAPAFLFRLRIPMEEK